jgi:hypothetical protein
MANKYLLTRPAIYGANLARPLLNKARLNTEFLDIGNVELDTGLGIGPIFYTALEFLGNRVPEIGDSAFYRLSKAVGALGYGASGVVNTIQSFTENPSNALRAVLDFGMFYQLIKDSFNEYREEGKSIPKDIGTLVKNVGDLPNRVRTQYNEGAGIDDGSGTDDGFPPVN